MEKIILSLGSNLEDRPGNLFEACTFIEKHLGRIENKSGIYETEPWGFESSDQFLNQVISIYSEKSAQEAMEIALSIENKMGRMRRGKGYSSRIIDIDILFVGRQILKNDMITVPHPRLHERKFVLVPLIDIEPVFVHPMLNKTVTELLDDCKDKLEVKLYKK